jgi:Ca-activated chloride channel family protein
VKLFCIGVGRDDGAPVPDVQGGFKKDSSGRIVMTRLDEISLKKMAVLTGGTYVRSIAGDLDLDAIYNREIRGKMEVATLSSGRKQIWEDRYQWFLILALIALIAELFLPSFPKKGLVAVLAAALLFSPGSVEAAGVYQSMQKGLKAYQDQDYEAALKFFIDAQLEDPDRSEILYNIGSAYYKLGDFSSAYENFTQILKSENRSLKQKALYNRGNTNYRMGKLDDAVSDYEAALKIDPEDQQAHQNLEFVRKMMEMKKKQQQESASQEQDTSKEQKESRAGKQEDGRNAGEKSDSRHKEDEDAGGPKSEFGQFMEAASEDEHEQESVAPESQKSSDDSVAGAARSVAEPDRDQIKQAERMLNRLEDMPGKAMMPDYRKREVEKDW